MKSLKYGDLCPRCNAASGIDTCPIGGGKGCPLEVKKLPKDYYRATHSPYDIGKIGQKEYPGE